MPKEIKKKLYDWYGGIISDENVVHVWKRTKTYCIVVFVKGKIECVRVFGNSFNDDIQVVLDASFDTE